MMLSTNYSNMITELDLVVFRLVPLYFFPMF